MARQARIEYPGAIHHVMCRGDRRKDIFLHDGDRPSRFRIGKDVGRGLSKNRLAGARSSRHAAYRLFTRWTREGVYFVSRLKQNADIQIVQDYPVPKGSNVLKDQRVRLQAFAAGRPDLEDLRMVTVWLEDKQEKLVLLTNHFELAASTIAAIYKERWQIELFFKRLKQQLKIKTFVGTTANAVRIRFWTALIAVLIIRYLQFRSAFQWAVSNLVALLRRNLFSYRDLWEWLNRPFDTPPEPSRQLQLNLDSIGASG